MPNTLNTLYPPMIETFMPAFVYNQPAPIVFSYSPYNSKTEITRIHVSVVNQKTNKSVLKTTYIPSQNNDNQTNGKVLDHIWIFDTSILGNSTSFNIPTSILKAGYFEPDTFYKVQLRFDKTIGIEPSDTNYLIEQRFNFSEWSSVCLIKAIDAVYIQIQGMEDIQGESYLKTVQPGIVPISAYLTVNNFSTGNVTKERLQKYKIQIVAEDDSIIDESNWIYTGDKQDDNSIYWLADLTNAPSDAIYTVQIDAVTQNQYVLSSKEYQLKISNYDPVKFTPIWTYKSVVLNSFGNYQTEEEKLLNKDKAIVTEEDGEIVFTIESEEDLPSGFLYVKRATSLDNFKKWELISCTKHVGVLKQTITDSTVGSLIKYRYACQYRLTQRDLFTTTKYSPEFIYPNFYDILLYRRGKQIAIRYNEQITSYASVVNRQIINTLGGKYPKFAENANINYKKISISGLLTVEADFNRKFINDRDYASVMNDYDYYMDGLYEVRNDTIADGDATYKNVSEDNYPATYDATHTNWENGIKVKGQSLPATAHDMFPKDNWWLEREFREQALAWLNDGEPKLFRSMTEGNLAVILTDISLTPNNQLGRRVYNISMTAYEIGDGYSLDTLSSLGIITIPNEYEEYLNSANKDEQDEELMTTISTIGQTYSKQVDKKSFGIVSNLTMLEKTTPPNEYSLIDLKNAFYTGILKTYQIDSKTFELKDLKIQFESKPQWYKVEDTEPEIIENPIKTNSNRTDIALGYKLGIITKADPSTIQYIFVNKKGYYQIPSNIIVTQIILYDNAKATFDYKISYKRTFNEDLIPSEIEIAEKIVGQISGKYFANQAISEDIKNKYEYYNIDSLTDVVKEHHYLNDITAIGFDGTPYTMLNIQFADEEKYTSFLVGQTGVYNLMTDYPIKEMTFAGRQMFRKDPLNYTVTEKQNFIFHPSTTGYTANEQFWKNLKGNTDVLVNFILSDGTNYQNIATVSNNVMNIEYEAPYPSLEEIQNPIAGTVYGVLNEESEIELWLYQGNDFAPLEISSVGVITITLNRPRYHLREWEFFVDESAEFHDSTERYRAYWYKRYFGQTNLEVNIVDSDAQDVNNPSQYIYKLGKDEYIPMLDGYKTTDEIKPRFNTVYRFQTNTNEEKYKIYYIDGKWYDVEFIEGTERQLIIAKVPVYGMINYRGNLIKVKYE